MSEQAPIPKYTATITIDANTLDELADELHAIYINWWQLLDGREEVHVMSGRRTIQVVVNDPEQTPERFASELSAWVATRRAKRARTSPAARTPRPATTDSEEH